MRNNFNSKYNIGQSVAEGIYNDLTEAFNMVEKGLFDKSFNKFKTIKGKVPSKKIGNTSLSKFKALDKMYLDADRNKDPKLKYRVIVKYSEVLVDSLDKNNMYLPSLRDTSQFA